MIPFFEQTGPMAIGSRLRMLSDRISMDSEQLCEHYGVGIRPKWFPVFYALSQKEAMSITDLAKEIGHSHPSVVNIVREMNKAGICSSNKDQNDGRKNIIKLTEKGKQSAARILPQYLDVSAAMDKMFAKSQHRLWEAINEFEYLLNQKSLYKRVMEEKKTRNTRAVEIIPYSEKHRTAFRELNEAWISQYFTMEAPDYEALDKPQEYILDKGGYIFFAILQGEPVGTCALLPIKSEQYNYELSKMAVSPKTQGLGIGTLLGEAIINKARDLGEKYLYLESNTVLQPAIRLYEKLGFEKVFGKPSPYERCNIQMELKL